jgi:hypothetical protein
VGGGPQAVTNAPSTNCAHSIPNIQPIQILFCKATADDQPVLGKQRLVILAQFAALKQQADIYYVYRLRSNVVNI